jgi:hypothetical protein
MNSKLSPEKVERLYKENYPHDNPQQLEKVQL